MKYQFGNSSSEDSGDFNDERAVNEGEDKHDFYIENAKEDEEGNLEEEDEFWQRMEDEEDERNKK